MLIVILVFVGFFTLNVECMSENLDYDLEDLEPDELIEELIRNQWEIDIQRDICPW